MKPSEILTKAADLIEPEGAWTQDEHWRTADGREHSDFVFRDDEHYYDPDDNPANAAPVCWCVLGALAHVAGLRDPETHDIEPYLPFLRKAGVEEPAIADWNDDPERTQSEVVAKLREAAALAESEGR